MWEDVELTRVAERVHRETASWVGEPLVNCAYTVLSDWWGVTAMGIEERLMLGHWALYCMAAPLTWGLGTLSEAPH